jgi:hypothetical protein
MLSSPDIREIATRLWLEEDGAIGLGSNVLLGTSLLHSLLSHPKNDTLERIVAPADGRTDEVAKSDIIRLQNALKAPNLVEGN